MFNGWTLEMGVCYKVEWSESSVPLLLLMFGRCNRLGAVVFFVVFAMLYSFPAVLYVSVQCIHVPNVEYEAWQLIQLIELRRPRDL